MEARRSGMGAPRARRAVMVLGVLVTLGGLGLHAGGAAAREVITLRPAADAGAAKAGLSSVPQTRARVLRVGGVGLWRSYVRFGRLPAAPTITRAVLRLTTRGPAPASLIVWVAHDRASDERTLTSAGARTFGYVAARWRRPPACVHAPVRCRRISIDLTPVARPGRGLALILGSRAATVSRIASRDAGPAAAPVLVIRPGPARGVPSSPGSSPVTVPPVPASSVAIAPPAPVAGLWTTAAELAGRPTSGAAWTAVKAAADASPPAAIADQDSDHDVDTLAAALVFARTGSPAYRTKVAAAIAAAIGTEKGGRTLALARNLASYPIAADLIALGGYDPALDARFRAWLSAVRSENLDGDTLVSTSEQRPNNWGTMAGASRVAADVYLGDTGDLNRAATVFRGWLGDRAAYSGFDFGDTSWQATPAQPVGLQPAGASKGGLSIDGALADDMRRGCTLTVPPCHTDYAWEGLQGVVVEARLLSRRGFDAFGWQDRAVLRAALFLRRLDQAYGGWWAANDDEWQPWLINRAYGTTLPATTPSSPGKIMGFTDWMLG